MNITGKDQMIFNKSSRKLQNQINRIPTKIANQLKLNCVKIWFPFQLKIELHMHFQLLVGMSITWWVTISPTGICFPESFAWTIMLSGHDIVFRGNFYFFYSPGREELSWLARFSIFLKSFLATQGAS